MKEYAYGVASGVVLAAFAWWWIAGTPVVETPAAEVRQGDGSLVLERRPGKAKPAAQLPKRAKLERQIRIDVQPERADCPVCTVDLSLVRMPDDTRRVVASSPTGEILSGLDVPVVSMEARRRWLAGALYNGRWGGLVARDVGPFVLGGAATIERDDALVPWLLIGGRF